MAFQSIRLLRRVLNDSLDALEDTFLSHSVDFPSLDQPFNPDTDAEILARQVNVTGIIDLVVSSAYQLISTVRDPFATLSDVSTLYHLSSSLRIAEKLNIPEILREAGSNGLHVNLIAEKINTEPTKLARCLRLLATHHIFSELEPDVFANNRISSYFDTGNDTSLLLKQPEAKYVKGAAAAGYIGTFTDDVFKASAYLLESLEDVKYGKSFNADKAALQKAVSTDKVYFNWLEAPGNEFRLSRYAACIRGTSLWDPPDTVLRGFSWDSLTPQSLIVDVGGGTGSPSMVLAENHTHLRIMIQDREAVVKQGTEFWEQKNPEALSSGRVSFQGRSSINTLHDFFFPQPVQNPAIFFVRTICHDWPDELVVKILGNLRRAAGETTKLILADYVMPYACPTKPDSSLTSDMNGSVPSQAPYPLLSNLGKAGANAYFIDMTMQVLLNGQERTFSHHTKLLAQSGWKVVELKRIECSSFGYITAEPS
ncbi:hypothetical protein M422DRAFT_51677 [Sphaerobolus stellatus SS14]|uniref:O-methyltransferase domain-containing protein n=1 Tax=Sphaerobolus stellatus (strain SS14) TaxID=990650 RepID=A0A0C9TWZ9_SPHS4|nr:hypothetical protein M422DRAFT_51677 [Sphaerobolus stellatus SS14]